MNPKNVLIVDDEPDLRELLEITLGRMGLDTSSAADYQSAVHLLDTKHFDLCLTDMRLPDGDGIELVEYSQGKYPDLPIAVITAHGNMESAVKALKAGAFDFVSKPLDINILRNLVNSAITLPEVSAIPEPSRPSAELHGDSTSIKQLREKISKLARSQAPVFIHGESGSGKELVARLIHSEGSRSGANFVPVNCGAIPAELMESEFFGHKKGSFTGATTDKQGLFQAANGGTLFLDEVADLPLHMQVKLLRAIQEKAVRPLGEQHEIPIDVRIPSASHKNLAKLVDQGKFRQDLYYRINVIELDVPSLRERIEDIPNLARLFLSNLSKKLGLPEARLSADAIDALLSYSYPGNVRELENILERALALAENNTITRTDLNLPASTVARQTTVTNTAKQPDTSSQSLEELERQAIIKALEETRWNKTAAAKKLDISRRQLIYRIEKLNIE